MTTHPATTNRAFLRLCHQRPTAEHACRSGADDNPHRPGTGRASRQVGSASSRRVALLEWGHLSATTFRGSAVRLRLFAPTRVWKWSLPLVAAALVTPVQATAPAQAPQNKKPSINIRTNPRSGFSPLRVVLTAELTGGADDFEDFYCASVEWDWGDGTKSESKIGLRSLRGGEKRDQAALRSGAHVSSEQLHVIFVHGILWCRGRSIAEPAADPVSGTVLVEAEEQDRRLRPGDDRGPARAGGRTLGNAELLNAEC